MSLAPEQSDLVGAMVSNKEYFTTLARVEEFQVGIELPKPPQCASTVVGSATIYVQGLFDPEEERQRLASDLVQKEDFLRRVQNKLQNKNFISRAPAKVVELERRKELDAKAEIEKLRASLADWAES